MRAVRTVAGDPRQAYPLLPFLGTAACPRTQEFGMPPTADLLARRDRTPAAAQPTRRRRRPSEPNPSAAAALQRALDRRDNGGSTGHL